MKHNKHILQIVVVLTTAIILSACGAKNAQPEATPVNPEAIFTSAAETVAAQLTQTAIAFSPTPEPATATPIPPTATLMPLNATAGPTVDPNLEATPTLAAGVIPTPTTIGAPAPLPSPTAIVPTVSGPICDNAEFVADITIPDGTVMQPGEDFYKIWRIKNTGVCTWDDGYGLIFAFGDPLDGQGFEIKRSADFVAPGQNTDIGLAMTAHLKEGEYSGCWIMRNDRGVTFGGIVCTTIVVKK